MRCEVREDEVEEERGGKNEREDEAEEERRQTKRGRTR